MKVVAIDYGRARIGLAISNKTKTIAFPFKTIKAGKNLEATANNILEAIKEKESEIEKIVIGLPILLNGQIGDMAKEVKELEKILKEKTKFPIVLVDERLTSTMADNSLKSLDQNRKKRSENIDAVAATIILQNYLDKNLIC